MQGVPLIIWTTLSEKIGCGPKNVIELVFLGFSHIIAGKCFGKFLSRSDDTQTYRLFAHFNLKVGKTKIKPQNSTQF